MNDPEMEPLMHPAEAPKPLSLDRECVPLLGKTDEPAPNGCDYDGRPDPQEFCMDPFMQLSAVPVCCARAMDGYQLIAPNLDRSGVHTTCDLPSIAEVRKGVGEQVSSFLEDLLIHDERRATEEQLITEDALRLPWLRIIAKIASREISVCCIPVSELAGKYLKHELEKMKSSVPQSTKWHGKARWWLSDSSTQVSGEDRVQRLVSAIIRSETKTHAFDSTARKKVRKHQKQDDHSLFRQLAQGFTPPGADASVIASTDSNHPVAGASRKVGVSATRDALHGAGYQMFDESISGAARDKKAYGRRETHNIKDLQHSNPDDAFVPGMVYTFVDQDVYINDFSKYAGENMVIITPEYTKLAGVGTDSTWYYTVTKDGEVVVTERVSTVNGQTCHTQRPWDYAANDFIYIDHLGKAAFTTYNVCIQYQPRSHHKWVWLARNSTTSLSKSVCDMMHNVAQGTPFDGVPLCKASNVVVVRGDSKSKQDTFLFGLFGETASPTYSIKYAYDQGADTSMELTENQFHVFNLMGKNRPKGYGVGEVKRTMQMHVIWRPGGLEPLLVAFFGIPIEYRPRPNIMYTSVAGSLAGEVVVEEGTAVNAAPNVAGDGPGVPDTKSDAAHDAYKKKRMEEFSNKIDPVDNIKDIVSLLLPAFIHQVSGETGISLGSATMMSREIMYERRTHALQAARLKRNNELDAREAMPKTFLKHEAGPKASAAPRGITQYTEEMAIQTGRVGLLIKEVLKNCSFYQPGNSPHDIAMSIRRLTEIAMHAANTDKGGNVSGLHDTDYSKMDETISECIYSWFVEFVLAFVHKSDYEEVKQILASNVDFTTMLNGKPTKTGFKNNSGSGVTTELNTVISAFIEYVSTCLAIAIHVHRSRDDNELDLSTVKKNTVRKALKKYAEKGSLVHLYWGDFMFKDKDVDMYSIPYAVIGPKFGDDGVGPHLPNISDDDWNAAATFFTKSIGMKLKVAFSRPEDGTFFLGRHYPKPLESLASYADVLKALRKLSVARNLDVEKYKHKLLGYWTTDSKTPGISEYLTAVAKMYGVDLQCYENLPDFDEDGHPKLTVEMANLLANDREVFYRVAGGPYCVEDEDVPMMTEAIATQVGFATTAELEQWLASLAECSTWEEIDAFQLPGMDFDPDAEPEGTVRMDGPVENLLSADVIQNVTPIWSDLSEFSFDELVEAAEFALEMLLTEEDGSLIPPSAAA